MATVTLVQVQPRRATDAAIVTVRLAGGGSRAYTQLGQTDWLAGVARPPRFASSLGFEQRGFTGGALPQTGAIRFAPSRGEVKTALGDLVWKGARIIVRVGDDENPAETYPVEFIGTVAAHSFDRGSLSLTVADLSVDLAKPVLSGTFAGTGGIEGDEEATGRAKRRSWGSVFNVEGFVLDKANLIYEFGDPARPLTSFPMVKDKGEAYSPVAVVTWQGSAAATLDALRSAAVADGGVAVAPSIACAKPWTRPAGPITADLIAEAVPGNGSRPTWIAVKIVREFAPDIVLPNENDAASWQAGEAGIHAADVSETAATILDRLLFPVSIGWVLLGSGALYFRRLAWDAPVFELAAETVEREVVYQPLRTRRVGFQLNNRIHSDGEISATILASVDPTYADGTPIDALRPAEAGSNVTETRTSAAFTGQGALATLNHLANGSQYLSGFGGLSFADIVKLGSTVADSFGTVLTNGQVITDQGTAAAIFGQGLLATLNQLANGSQYLSGFGALSALPSIAFGSDYLLEQPGGVAASLSAFKTVLGTAAGFFGQGALATLNAVAYGTQIANLPSAISPGAFFDNGRLLYASRVVYDDAGLVSSYRPEEANSNRTESRTSAAFYGQGILATLNSLSYGGGQITDFPTAIAPANLRPGGNIDFFWIQDYSSVRLSERWPQEGGANVTENRTSAAIVGQGYGATAPRANVDNTYVAIGTNVQIDSAFARGAATWSLSGSSMSGAQLGFNRADYSGLRSVGYMFSPGVQAAGTQVDASGLGPWGQPGVRDRMLRYSMPVKAGDTIGIRTLVGIHRCTATLYLLLYRADGTLKSAPATAVGAIPGGGVGGDGLGEMSFIYKNTDPEIAAAQFMLRMVGTGESDPYVFWSEPWLGKLQDGQNVIPPYAPGPADPTSDQTGANTAAAIAGQTQFATLPAGTSLDNGVFGMPSRLGNYGGFLSADQMTYTGGPGTVSVASLRPGEAGSNITENRNAAGFYGQGALATTDTIGNDGQLSGTIATRLTPYPGDANYLLAGRLAWAEGDTVQNYKPQERGANVTENRTASAILGQSGFATASGITRDSLFSAGYFNLNAFSLGYSITRSDGVSTVTESLVVTQVGISSGFYGQGGLATRDSVTGDDVLNGRLKNANGSVYWDLAAADGRRQIVNSGYRYVDGAAIGANDDVIQWYGPTSVPEGSETKTNGVWAFGTDGKVYYGTAELGAGGGNGAKKKSGSFGINVPSGQTSMAVQGGVAISGVPASPYVDVIVSLSAQSSNTNQAWVGAVDLIAQDANGTEILLSEQAASYDPNSQTFFPDSLEFHNTSTRSGSVQYLVRMRRTGGPATTLNGGGTIVVTATPQG